VANLQERVTELEQQSDRYSTVIDGLRTEVALMRSEMATRTDIAELRRETGDLRGDLNRRIDLLDAKVDRHFVWLAGIMVSGFIAVIGALVSVVFRLN